MGALWVYRLTYGRAADHGGIVDPRTTSTSMPDASPALSSVGALVGCAPDAGPAFGGVAVAASTSLVAGTAMVPCAGSSPQVYCSSTLYGWLLSTLRQLSIEPVGQGEMHAMQKLHRSALTT
jgi:hypothetical protein